MTGSITLFDANVARMRRIFRGEESFGEGKPAEQARRFHRENIFQTSIDLARERTPLGEKRVNLLISLSGFSPETTIIAYELLKPEQVVVIRSSGLNESLDRIAEHIVGPGKLKPSEFQHFEIDPSDPLAIHRIVAEHANRDRNRRQRAVIDITGGKKVMSAAAALAAWQLDLEIAYIDSDYDGELRQPNPGSERLVLLENPITLFGHEELKTGREIFATGAFANAADRFEALAKRVANPSEARLLAAIAHFYAAWCDLNFEMISESSSDLANGIQQSNFKLSVKDLKHIKKQLEFAKQLVVRKPRALLISYFLLGEHYWGLGRKDFAALLFYRTIEGCLADRDELFGKEQRNNAEYRSRFAELSIEIDPRDPQREPSEKPGLIERAAWLAAMQDDMVKKAEIATIASLKNLKNMADIRNKSILAHGSETVSDKDCKSLQAKASFILHAWWICGGGDGRKFDDVLSELQFIAI